MNPRIRVLSGSKKGLELAIGRSELRIGTGARNDIRLDDPLASTQHCKVSFDEGRSLLLDCASEHGTFVGDFSFGAKYLIHGEHIRAGRTILIYLLEDVVAEELLKLTPDELRWVNANYSPDRAGMYEAAKGVTLAALLQLNTRMNGVRSADELQTLVLEFLFRVMAVQNAAILLAGYDGERFVSATCHPASFPTDDRVTSQVLREGTRHYQDKVVCCPMTTFDTKVGVLYATMSGSQGEWFTGHHMEVLESLASSTAIALERLRYVTWLESENQRLNELVFADHGMIGESNRMKDVYRFISRVGSGERPVLILGASGTGKELVAYAIHRASPRAGNRFIPVNCGAFSESLLQSELFGYERGAFTGATTLRKGLFEEADGCTVFLDEIGEMPLNMQSDLLRVLQQGEVKRLGGSNIVKVNVRIIAATNRNLREEVQKGRFREDLFYRLNVLPLEMPSLAERRDDIALLAAHFIRKYRHLRCAPHPEVLGIHPDAHQALAAYSWPGNVRELENAVEFAISMGATPYIIPDDLPKEITTAAQPTTGAGRLYDREYEAFLRSLFERVLRETSGNKAEAARRLGWHPVAFRRRCTDFRLD